MQKAFFRVFLSANSKRPPTTVNIDEPQLSPESCHSRHHTPEGSPETSNAVLTAHLIPRHAIWTRVLRIILFSTHHICVPIRSHGETISPILPSSISNIFLFPTTLTAYFLDPGVSERRIHSFFRGLRSSRPARYLYSIGLPSRVVFAGVSIP